MIVLDASSLLTSHAEVGKVLRRYVRLGEIPVDRAEGALEDLRHLPLRRYAHGPLLGRIAGHWARVAMLA